MLYIGDNFIHLPNPDHPESDFRKRPGTTNQVNIVGSATFGNGIEVRYGLLKNSGETAIFGYLFPKDKFNMLDAQKWLDEHKQKVNKESLINKEFTTVIPIVKHYVDDNGTLFLKGEASNMDLDLQNDQMDITAINQMKEQSIGKTGFLNHKYDIGKDDFGVIVGYEKSADKFIPIFEVFDDKKQMLLNRIKKNVKFGLSVGGKIKDAIHEVGRRVIKSVKLKEVSLTYFPANDSTLGTVGIVKGKPCMGGICKQIYKSIDKMEGGFNTAIPVYVNDDFFKAINWQVNTKAVTFLMDLIKTGKINKGNWSKPNAGDFKDITEYSNFCIAKDQNGDPNNASSYGYPAGKNGEIYYAGVDAARKAAAGSHTGDEIQNIYAATNKLWEALQLKLEKGDGNVGEIKIPEDVNLEKETVDKIVELKKDNKAINFIKTILGIEKEDITKEDLKPEQIKALNTACTGGDVKACQQLKDAGITKEQIEKIIKKEQEEETITKDEDIRKELDTIKKKNDELEQTVYKQGQTIEKMQKTTKEAIEEAATEKHNTLVKDTIESYTILKEDIADEKALKEKLVKDEGYTEKQIKEDIDSCLKETLRANKIAAKKIKAHPNPSIINPITKEQGDKYQKKVDQMKKEVENIGVAAPVEE